MMLMWRLCLIPFTLVENGRRLRVPSLIGKLNGLEGNGSLRYNGVIGDAFRIYGDVVPSITTCSDTSMNCK
jgi:hypothetical protein